MLVRAVPSLWFCMFLLHWCKHTPAWLKYTATGHPMVKAWSAFVKLGQRTFNVGQSVAKVKVSYDLGQVKVRNNLTSGLR